MSSESGALHKLIVKRVTKDNNIEHLNEILDQAQEYINDHGDVQVLTFPSGMLDNEYKIYHKITGKALTDKNKGHLIEIQCTGDIRYCLNDYFSTDFVDIFKNILMKVTKYDFHNGEFDDEHGVLTLWWEPWGTSSSVLDNPNFDVETFDVSELKS